MGLFCGFLRQIAQRNALFFSAVRERETIYAALKPQRGFFRVQYNQKERRGTAHRTQKGVPCMKRLLIRADDLGYSQGVNCGIAATVAAGLVRSVGVMTNMPAAVHGLGLLAGHPVCLGQHTNICVGRPLTDPARIPSLCTPEGEFKPSHAYREAAKAGEDFVVLEEVIEEIEAQYRQFKALTGREPGYFEGHAVASPNFFKGLEMVAGDEFAQAGVKNTVCFHSSCPFSQHRNSSPGRITPP